MNSKNNSLGNIVLAGLTISVVLTALVSLVAANLEKYILVGVTVPFAYPWRLVEPDNLARLTAWSGYLIHNISVWVVIYQAQQAKLRLTMR